MYEVLNMIYEDAIEHRSDEKTLRRIIGMFLDTLEMFTSLDGESMNSITQEVSDMILSLSKELYNKDNR